ncbi:DUF899 family protein [Ruania alba]|uniref:Predicted dithiol-disulfide oxidoreductase, DUF899 family n=1 Tax=Ruania alba TaxID=648782 RepID=A0A1H5C011_9MICO|nr:DUF899 family protein [Ruania alba]SED59801.1 Predicted dithiol-disulfide oxidoreductase, DUF899 family [Ruania alba]
MTDASWPAPPVVDRATWQAEIDELRAREKANTRERDAIAAARRRLPMVAVDAATPLHGPDGTTSLLDAFEGRRQLLAYFFMWHPGHPAAEQCGGCTWCASQVRELSYLHSRDITFAILCKGPYAESVRYRDFLGWQTPWYGVPELSRTSLLVGRDPSMMFIVCYLREGDQVFETYWTTRRGVEELDNSYALMDLTPYGRQETWQDVPPGWPQQEWQHAGGNLDGRPIPHWPRLAEGWSDRLDG